MASSKRLLFSPITLRSVEVRNRVWLAPMCQYSCEGKDGIVGSWHLVNLGSRAVGGCGLVMTEATAVRPDGRISPYDAGIWSEAHAEAWKPVAAFVSSQGAVPCIQLAHAGRKGSTDRPWAGGKLVSPDDPEAGGWRPIAPSAVPFNDKDPSPLAMSKEDIADVREAFVAGARLALAAGFRAVELHFAHGYLAHEFLSPLSNAREDEYGGAFENRVRFPLETARAVRAVWPEGLPLLVRISATDWAEGGWTADESVRFCRLLREEAGVDLVDVSSGGLVPRQQIPLGPGYQVPFAERVRKEAGVPTGAVGLITEPEQAEAILQDGSADVVFLGRELLRDPYWPLHAARALKADAQLGLPNQYLRAKNW
jgi:2,4-dienoyl-CoA reductase-like NADH-dependent reductase (Old Yellow Enzyme family)